MGQPGVISRSIGSGSEILAGGSEVPRMARPFWCGTIHIWRSQLVTALPVFYLRSRVG